MRYDHKPSRLAAARRIVFVGRQPYAIRICPLRQSTPAPSLNHRQRVKSNAICLFVLVVRTVAQQSYTSICHGRKVSLLEDIARDHSFRLIHNCKPILVWETVTLSRTLYHTVTEVPCLCKRMKMISIDGVDRLAVDPFPDRPIGLALLGLSRL